MTIMGMDGNGQTERFLRAFERSAEAQAMSAGVGAQTLKEFESITRRLEQISVTLIQVSGLLTAGEGNRDNAVERINVHTTTELMSREVWWKRAAILLPVGVGVAAAIGLKVNAMIDALLKAVAG